MPFLYFEVNGRKLNCDKHGYPINLRQTPRNTVIGEVELEKTLLHRIKQSTLDIETTEAYVWLTSKLGHPMFYDIVSIGRLIAMNFDIKMPREVYRRRITTLFWFHEHWMLIKDILRRNNIIGHHSAKGKINFAMPLPRWPTVIFV